MSTRLKQKPESALYDRDFYLWAQQAAGDLRSGDISHQDREFVAGELEDMAKNAERELKSRTRNVIHHLLKWVAQPAHRTPSWMSTIIRDRAEIEDLLEQSPSLEYKLRDGFNRVYDRAMRMALADTGLDSSVFPAAVHLRCKRLSILRSSLMRSNRPKPRNGTG